MPSLNRRSVGREPSSLYSSLVRVGATEAVVRRLEGLIVENELRPGDPLPAERKLAEGLAVGRNVVREALRVLVQKGLIEVVAGRGAFVIEPDPAIMTESLSLLLRRRRVTLREINDVRLLIEPEVAMRAARNATAENTRDLRACLRKLELSEDDAELHVQADLEFHREIARLSNHVVFQTIFDAVQDVMLWGMRFGIKLPGAAAVSDDRHRRIVAAIIAGKPETARREMEIHMRTVAGYASEQVARVRRRNAPEGRVHEA